MIYLLFGFFFASRVFSDVMRKKNSKVFSTNGLTSSLFYVFETSLFALFYFWVLNGFVLHFNGRVLLYGLLYGLVVLTTLVPSVFLYNYTTFAFASFVSGSFSLIMSLLSGWLVFGEAITADKLFRVVLMLMATGVIFLGRRGDLCKSATDEKGKRSGARNLIIAVLLITFTTVVGAAGTAIMKFYSADPAVTDQNSFFFATNVFSALLVLPILPFTMRHDGVSMGDLFGMVKSKKTLYSAITTINSNLNSIVQMLLLGMMEVSVFTPLSSAFSFAAVAIATPIIGEKLDKYTVISTAIAIASVVLPPALAALIG